MVGQIVLLIVGAMCLGSGGFVCGLTWPKNELGVAEHRLSGLKFCMGFGALGAACLALAGAVA